MNPIKFHGTGRQFFNIWIVNILLTIVTLGIYAAWAHVRTKKYFYGNTELAGDRFEYLATPKQVLIGYLVMFVLFVLATTPILGTLIMLILLIASPWLIQRSLRFNAQMTRFRGIRFDFKGSVKDAFVSFVVRPLLGVLILLIIAVLLFGFVHLLDIEQSSYLIACICFLILVSLLLLLYYGSWVSKGIYTYVHNNYFYGSEQFNAQYNTNTFFKLNLISVLIVLAILAVPLLFSFGLIATLFEMDELELSLALTARMLTGLTALCISLTLTLAILIGSAYYTCKTRNYTYNQTFIGQDKKYHLSSTMVVGSYIILLVSNFLMVIFSLGLFSPFARVRLARYLASATQVHGDLDELTTKELSMNKTSSIGDAVATGFDFNVNF